MDMPRAPMTAADDPYRDDYPAHREAQGDRMTARDGSAALPVLFTPEEIAKQLGRSGWWVREQCRRDRFPHTRAGGAIRFTRQQFEELLQILERRPDVVPTSGRTAPRRSSKKPFARDHAPSSQLRARPPRKPRPSSSSDAAGHAA